MERWRVTSVMAVLLGSPTLAVAQDAAQPSFSFVLTPGSRVRVVSTAIHDPLTGVVIAADETAITLAPDARPPLKLPLQSLTGVDLSLGRKRNTLKGLGFGALAGVALGLASSVDPDNCDDDSGNFCSRSDALVGGTLGGAVLGAGIGALIKGERWTAVKVAPGPGRAAGPRPRGLGIAMVVRF